MKSNENGNESNNRYSSESNNRYSNESNNKYIKNLLTLYPLWGMVLSAVIGTIILSLNQNMQTSPGTALTQGILATCATAPAQGIQSAYAAALTVMFATLAIIFVFTAAITFRRRLPIAEFFVRYWGLTLLIILFVIYHVLHIGPALSLQGKALTLPALALTSPAETLTLYLLTYTGFVYGKKFAKKLAGFQNIEPIFPMIILALFATTIAIYIMGNPSLSSPIISGVIKVNLFTPAVFLCCIAIGILMATLKYPHPGFNREHPLIINGRIYAQHVTGVQRYGIEIIKQIDKMVEPGEVILALPHGELQTKPDLKNIELAYIGKGNGNKWTQFHLPIFAYKKKGTILTLAAVAPAVKPDYVATHDISFMRFPESYGKKFRIMYAIGYFVTLYRCKGIITISEFSKNELINFYNLDEDRFTIAGNSAEQLTDPYEEQALSKWGIGDDEPYYLSVGSKNLHKNQRFIKELAKKYPDRKFVVAGGSSERSFGTNGNISLENQTEENPENLVITGYITDDEVRTLYAHAHAFIFPSLYEGFGIPPLEAILMGVKRVAVADIPVLREIYTKGCYFFNPRDVESFDITELDDLSDSITDEIREYYISRHSWKNSAKIILDLIR